jgi:hypothetical protein
MLKIWKPLQPIRDLLGLDAPKGQRAKSKLTIPEFGYSMDRGVVTDDKVVADILGLESHYVPTISNMTQCSVTGVAYNIQAIHTQAGLGSSQGVNVTRNVSRTYGFGTGTGNANQVVVGVITIAAAANVSLAMDTMTLANIIGTPTPTFTKVKEIIIELLGLGQADQDNGAGTACSNLTIGNATQPWPWIVTGAVTVDLENAGVLHANKPASWTVTAGDLLKIVNADAVNAARIQLTLIGEG